MRIRLFGHYVHLAVALLAAAEAVVFFASVYGAVLVRFHGSLRTLPATPGPQGTVWPSAALFSAVMVVCVLAFGLYSAR